MITGLVWLEAERENHRAYVDDRLVGVVVRSLIAYGCEEWQAWLAWNRPNIDLGVYSSNDRARRAVEEAGSILLSKSQGSEAAKHDTAVLPPGADQSCAQREAHRIAATILQGGGTLEDVLAFDDSKWLLAQEMGRPDPPAPRPPSEEVRRLVIEELKKVREEATHA